jgi:hypothetical protein
VVAVFADATIDAVVASIAVGAMAAGAIANGAIDAGAMAACVADMRSTIAGATFGVVVCEGLAATIGPAAGCRAGDTCTVRTVTCSAVDRDDDTAEATVDDAAEVLACEEPLSMSLVSLVLSLPLSSPFKGRCSAVATGERVVMSTRDLGASAASATSAAGTRVGAAVTGVATGSMSTFGTPAVGVCAARSDLVGVVVGELESTAGDWTTPLGGALVAAAASIAISAVEKPAGAALFALSASVSSVRTDSFSITRIPLQQSDRSMTGRWTCRPWQHFVRMLRAFR